MPGPGMSPSLAEIDQKMADIMARIAKEQKIIDASNAIRLATRNADVLRKTDAEEREARKSLEYFHVTLNDLRSKRDQLLASSGNLNQPYNPGERPLPSPPLEQISFDLPSRTKQYTNLGETRSFGAIIIYLITFCYRLDQSRYPSHACEDSANAQPT